MDDLLVPCEDDLFGPSEVRVPDDYEASNRQMAIDFDFDTAGCAPDGYGNTAMTAMGNARHANTAKGPFRMAASFTSLAQVKHHPSPPRLPASQTQFYLATSRETSPMNKMLPGSAPSPWAKHSPSSGLEETFNGITMNGDTTGNSAFSPNLRFSPAGFSMDPIEPSTTPSTYNKDLSSPPSTANSAEGRPVLTVYPTSLKSRVETQIPIKMILAPLPAGVAKLRLPAHSISKPKFLAKPEAGPSPDTLELHTSLVCTSAMQDQAKVDRAFARARGEDVGPPSKPSPGSSSGSQSSRDDEEMPLNGGEVKICPGCIQRERKRASRKKQKKPDEEEMFQKNEAKRVVVFNTNEIKEWLDPAGETSAGLPGFPTHSTLPQLSKGAMQVELPMRIACYCRHQNEKLGFQVIFTIKDQADKVIAQAMTNSIMITDDHKAHNLPPTSGPTPNPSLPNTPVVAAAVAFANTGMDMNGGSATMGPKSFKQSLSTTDLQGLEHNFNPNFPMNSSSHPFALPSGTTSATSATPAPRNLSRPASPTGMKGSTKRRKQSGSGKIPSGLTMTKLETSQPLSGPSTVPNTATTTSFPPNFLNMAPDRYLPAGMRQAACPSSPSTPNHPDGNFMNAVSRSFSMENLTQQAMMSTPGSRQPSRPGSAASKRNSLNTDPSANRLGTNQLFANQSRRPPPLIHKLVPSEGSMTGGTEVTLLGNGFYQGLEVMFGDTEATTTTFWGEKCLNCIAPPTTQAGSVPVVFKHEHHLFASMQQQSQIRPTFFTYIDDREVQIYRMAMKTLGKQMQQPNEDPYATAQRLLGGRSPHFWSMGQGAPEG